MMQPNGTAQLREGVGTRITRTQWGQCISMQGATWHHPWFTAAYWWPAQKQWVAVVRPGFLNGRAPCVSTTAERMKSTPSFLAPITAWDGAADIAQAAQLATDDEYAALGPNTQIYVPLYRNPLLTLSFRELGGVDGPIPKYFTRRGVTADSGRRVVSGDVVLHQPRLALTSQISYPTDLVLGSSIVTQTLGERAPASNDTLKVVAMPQINPPENYDPGTGDLVRSYEEQTWDELLIATVFLVSPPHATGNPDGSWIPAVQHALFWNLHWTQPRLQPIPSAAIPGSLSASFSVLAGGAGQLVINSLVASINDMTNEAINITVANSMAGTFWTPTGGGSDSTFPTATTATTDSFGLAKDARNKAKRAAAIASGALIDSLDPTFPYKAVPFALSLLN